MSDDAKATTRDECYSRDMPVRSPTMTRHRPGEIQIIADCWYLVITNGWEWRGPFILRMEGWLVIEMLKSEIVRGCPEWIALITNPEHAP